MTLGNYVLAIYLIGGAISAVWTMYEITVNRNGTADSLGKRLQSYPEGYKVLALILIPVIAFLLWPMFAYGQIRKLGKGK